MICLIIALAAVGLWEVYVFHYSHQEEDFLLMGMCFAAAGILSIFVLGGAW